MKAASRTGLLAALIILASAVAAQPTPKKYVYSGDEAPRFPWTAVVKGNSYDTCSFEWAATGKLDQSSARATAKAFASAFLYNPEFSMFMQNLMLQSWEWVLAEAEHEIKEAFEPELAQAIIEGDRTKLKEMQESMAGAIGVEFPVTRIYPVDVKLTETLSDGREQVLVTREVRTFSDATTFTTTSSAFVVTCLKVGDDWRVDDCKSVDGDFDTTNATEIPPAEKLYPDATIRQLVCTDEWPVSELDTSKSSRAARAPIGELMQHCYGRQYNVATRAFKQLFQAAKQLFTDGYVKRAPEIDPFAERKNNADAESAPLKRLELARSTTSERTGSYEFTYELKHDGSTVIDALVELKKTGDKWVVVSAKYRKDGAEEMTPISSLFDVTR